MQCRPTENPCIDTAEWQCPRGWTGQETETLLSSLAVSLQENCAGVSGSGDFEECYQSKCCASPSFACFKKAFRRNAQCRPLTNFESCRSDSEWTCPAEWILLDDTEHKAAGTVPTPAKHNIQTACSLPGVSKAGKFENCYESMCCGDAGFDCYKSARHTFSALCRPTQPQCLDTEDWICPRTLSKPSNIKSAGALLLQMCASTGAAMYQNCFDTHCCAHPGFGCFKMVGKAFAECRPLGGHIDSCKSDEEWICPTEWDLSDEPTHETSLEASENTYVPSAWFWLAVFVLLLALAAWVLHKKGKLKPVLAKLDQWNTVAQLKLAEAKGKLGGKKTIGLKPPPHATELTEAQVIADPL